MEGRVSSGHDVIPALRVLVTPVQSTARTGAGAGAGAGDTGQGRGEAIEYEDQCSNDTNSGGQTQVQLVVHIGSSEAVHLSAEDCGNVDDIKHGHDDDESVVVTVSDV